MEEPDKIWIDAYEWYYYYPVGVKCEEYIRKDALLEWIQKARSIPHENAIVRDLTFQEVVNKINSM